MPYPRHLRPRHVRPGRRLLATAATLLLAGTAALTAGCRTESERPDPAAVRESCQQYHRIVNQWSAGYGAEMGAVGQAAAAGDQRRRDTAVAVVRELFVTTAQGLREQAEQTDHRELAGALTEAADGLTEIAGEIETYQDVTEAPERMSTGRFATGGARVSAICAE